ncbi:hypothetical protein C488_14015 [Natrinema pellirubrum DSM 15624]|uniref:Uncharacterized protein n=1 Tax=Natrinema pellirubrum (strain DSM 15624 / CIP 106293 / JCM 10476 / NCIMB 786 / 157) TaxID=797303 RepID=L0JL61_NATP1|nr:hypothetical protein [Natrinema pellirubrum]AGB31588.1 hypothetical protein Natpe_1694 [Natrinema pellirubrum DSM 15624]ELY73159.1 hypothetical protein C488_14015 [Natrinema pellirubrum DSM 15624]
MRLADVPVVGDLLESGAEDRVFDSLLLAGPVLILIIAVLGRSTVTVGLAAAYVLFFVAYVLYRGVRR